MKLNDSFRRIPFIKFCYLVRNISSLSCHISLYQVAALRELKKQELIDFFNKHIKNDAPLKKALSVRVYGKLHASEYTSDNIDAPPANTVKIDDIFSFRRSQTLYGSIKGSYGLGKL